jgi:ubiquinone/menaquinone biosynthesis C-methylase UbiE
VGAAAPSPRNPASGASLRAGVRRIGLRSILTSADSGPREGKMKPQRYHKRIKLKYWFLSFFYDSVEIFFYFDENTNPRHGLARLIPNEKLRILDVCFGTGNSTLLVARNNGNNLITGIDLSADMLEVANRKIRKLGLPNIATLRMDAADMHLEDDSFDVATSSFGIHEMEYPVVKSILREMNRVLKKGGKLYLVDYRLQDTKAKRFLFRVYLLLTSPPHVVEFLRYDWDAIMEECGFRIDKIEPYKISQIICATCR